jgi:hypothetical protein
VPRTLADELLPALAQEPSPQSTPEATNAVTMDEPTVEQRAQVLMHAG